MEAPPPERPEDMAAGLKRLRRENGMLRQEREILKRAAAFLAKEGGRRGSVLGSMHQRLMAEESSGQNSHDRPEMLPT